jgi:hypothetical protein
VYGFGGLPERNRRRGKSDVDGDNIRMVCDGTRECGNEPTGSIKCGKILDSLQTVYPLKKDKIFH